MNELLFNDADTLQDSPRLAWMKQHGIVLYHHQSVAVGANPCWMAGFQEWQPKCTDPADFFFWETAANGETNIVIADTAEEALGRLAHLYDLPHWASL